MEQAFIVVTLTDGSVFEAPKDNLENIRRLFTDRIKNIVIKKQIKPVATVTSKQGEVIVQKPQTVGKPKGRPKKTTV